MEIGRREEFFAIFVEPRKKLYSSFGFVVHYR